MADPEANNTVQLIFDFFEEDEVVWSDDSLSDFSMNSDSVENFSLEEQEFAENEVSKAEAAKAFWDSQEELLMETLRRTSSFESKIRQATKDILKELNSVGVHCVCRNMVTDGCRKCRQRELCYRIQEAGYSSCICKSKWRSSPGIPAGEHTYMEVMQTSASKKGEMKVIIELNFRAEFTVARACEEYTGLVARLPEIFVGKPERLRNLVKILCSASKKCMKEKQMHMAPWRKQKYMQAKWIGKPAENSQEKTQVLGNAYDNLKRPPRPRASMLTFDLLDNVPGLNFAPMTKVL